MYCDYHTHTPLCLHASGTPQEYVQAAVRAGQLAVLRRQLVIFLSQRLYLLI